MPTCLIIGGYGLIGSATAHAFHLAGWDVHAIGRSREIGERVLPFAMWHIHDVTRMSTDNWMETLGSVDVVVNAAGALQDGADDQLNAIHIAMLETLLPAIQTCGCGLIQISAAGVDAQSTNPFLASKAKGDELIRQSKVRWSILRPAMILAPSAYGGSALLRAASSLPWMLPNFPDKMRMQTQPMSSLIDVILDIAQENRPYGETITLSEQSAQSINTLLKDMRHWHGFKPAMWSPQIPSWAVTIISTMADGLGRLGWKSPLRSSAIQTMTNWEEVTPDILTPSFTQTLRQTPATWQDRWFARLYLMFPVFLCAFALFWITSGVMGFLSFTDAYGTLTLRGMSTHWAQIFVICGSMIDIGIGASALVKRWTRIALWGSMLTALGYLGAATLLTPDLWGDPLGPLVKVIPVLCLSLVLLILHHER